MRFLTIEEVLELHDDQLREDCGGGSTGLLSLELLYSAVAQPEATFGGDPLHRSVWEQAAAYAYHLARNHPFVDGNKRTALNATLMFLHLNGHAIRQDANDQLVEMLVRIAEGQLSEPEVASLLRTLADG